MPAIRNPVYDTQAFRDHWHGPLALKDIAEHYGVSSVAIHKAGMRRGMARRGHKRKETE